MPCVPAERFSGRTAGSKLSLSADSIDSEATPFIERHRISKSILKKSESSNNYYSNAGGDSDTEKLIACDNTSCTTAMCDNDGGLTLMGDAFPNVYGTRAISTQHIHPPKHTFQTFSNE